MNDYKTTWIIVYKQPLPHISPHTIVLILLTAQCALQIPHAMTPARRDTDAAKGFHHQQQRQRSVFDISITFSSPC